MPPLPESLSNEPPTITAPGLRMKPRPGPSPIPSATTGNQPAGEAPTPPPPLPEDPIDAQGIPSGDKPLGATGKAGPATFRHIARGFVTTASMAINHRLAPDYGTQEAQELWIATEEESALIGDSAAAYAARKGLTTMTPETAELITMAAGIAGYLMKNLMAALYMRMRDRRHSKGAPLEAPEPEQQ
jgi:hypothetical protein